MCQREGAPLKFYFDENKDPIYHIFPEGRCDALFAQFPLEPMALVFGQWEECASNQGALEAELPLAANDYPHLARSQLATLRTDDYPSHAAARELLAAVCGAKDADVPRFLKGLLQKVKRLKSSEERSQLIDRELALFNHFHKGVPLTLERLKKVEVGCEEAMIEGLASTAYFAFALQLAGQLLERKIATSSIVALLENPAASTRSAIQNPL